MNRSVADLNRPATVEPDERVPEPVLVIALGIILARMGAAALGPILGRMQSDDRLLQQVFELERLGEVAVPDHRAV